MLLREYPGEDPELLRAGRASWRHSDHPGRRSAACCSVEDLDEVPGGKISPVVRQEPWIASVRDAASEAAAPRIRSCSVPVMHHGGTLIIQDGVRLPAAVFLWILNDTFMNLVTAVGSYRYFFRGSGPFPQEKARLPCKRVAGYQIVAGADAIRLCCL